MGLILISHDLDLVAAFCDRVLVMERGVIVESCAANALRPGAASLYPPPARGPPAARRVMIEARALTARFGATTVVDGVSFAVAAGEAFGIVGESGSGKSTLLRVIAGPARGLVGRAACSMARPQGRHRAHRGRVQMVFQDPYGSLHPRHTRRPRAGRAAGDPRRRRRRRTHRRRACARSGSMPRTASAIRISSPAGSASAWRSRARSSSSRRSLLLDEPTAALDVSVQAEIIALLQRLRRERRLTYVLVSHNLAVVAQLCDRIGVMREGRIIEEAVGRSTHLALRRGSGSDTCHIRVIPLT